MFEKFIKSFPITKGNKKEPYIILFDAYTGMGKSTVSKLIASYDNSIILNNDEVREFLNDYSDSTNLKKELQEYRLKELLKEKNSCILDRCFNHNFDEKIKYIKNLKVKYYIIRLICDEKTIKKRLNIRKKDSDNYSIATYKDYLWMKNNVSYIDDKLIDFEIDTTKNLIPQVKEFLDKYDILNK